MNQHVYCNLIPARQLPTSTNARTLCASFSCKQRQQRITCALPEGWQHDVLVVDGSNLRHLAMADARTLHAHVDTAHAGRGACFAAWLRALKACTGAKEGYVVFDAHSRPHGSSSVRGCDSPDNSPAMAPDAALLERRAVVPGYKVARAAKAASRATAGNQPKHPRPAPDTAQSRSVQVHRQQHASAQALKHGSQGGTVASWMARAAASEGLCVLEAPVGAEADDVIATLAMSLAAGRNVSSNHTLITQQRSDNGAGGGDAVGDSKGVGGRGSTERAGSTQQAVHSPTSHRSATSHQNELGGYTERARRVVVASSDSDMQQVLGCANVSWLELLQQPGVSCVRDPQKAHSHVVAMRSRCFGAMSWLPLRLHDCPGSSSNGSSNGSSSSAGGSGEGGQDSSQEGSSGGGCNKAASSSPPVGSSSSSDKESDDSRTQLSPSQPQASTSSNSLDPGAAAPAAPAPAAQPCLTSHNPDGLAPSQHAHYLALLGKPEAGVKGAGVSRNMARSLITRFKSVEGVIHAWEEGRLTAGFQAAKLVPGTAPQPVPDSLQRARSNLLVTQLRRDDRLVDWGAVQRYQADMGKRRAVQRYQADMGKRRAVQDVCGIEGNISTTVAGKQTASQNEVPTSQTRHMTLVAGAAYQSDNPDSQTAAVAKLHSVYCWRIASNTHLLDAAVRYCMSHLPPPAHTVAGTSHGTDPSHNHSTRMLVHRHLVTEQGLLVDLALIQAGGQLASSGPAAGACASRGVKPVGAAAAGAASDVLHASQQQQLLEGCAGGIKGGSLTQERVAVVVLGPADFGSAAVALVGQATGPSKVPAEGQSVQNTQQQDPALLNFGRVFGEHVGPRVSPAHVPPRLQQLLTRDTNLLLRGLRKAGWVVWVVLFWELQEG